MAIDADTLAANIEIGYRMQISMEDANFQNRLLYHGRLGGDLPEFGDGPMFFYAEPERSSAFVEHIFINGETYMEAAELESNEAFCAALLAHTPVVLCFRVSVSNPLVLDMGQLLRLADVFGIQEDEQDDFAAKFEDSDPEVRNRVFSWAKANGYDGAIIVNDMTPMFAGGDWCFRPSFVAFNPKTQVRSAFSLMGNETDIAPVAKKKRLSLS